MTNVGTYFWAAALLLLVLVFIHELGHFVVAKLCGVYVEAFSLGFGPILARYRFGETEYRLSWLPLGGYVKMLGELPGEELSPEQRARSFLGQPPGRRIAISLAGPAMNLIFPVFVVAGMLMAGVSTPTTLLGGVRPGSPAAKAGLLGGDRIVEVAGEPVWRWEDLSDAVQSNAGAPLTLTLERQGRRFAATLQPQPAPGRSGWMLGVDHAATAAVLSLPQKQSPARRAGLETGDRVTSLNGAPVSDWYGFLAGLEQAQGPLALEVARGPADAEEHIRVTLRSDGTQWTLERFGAVPVDFAVLSVLPGTPARKAGLQSGDLLIRSDGEPLNSFGAFAKRIREGEGRPIKLALLRQGRELEVEVKPERSAVEHEGQVETAWRIGLIGGPPIVPGEVREEHIWNPFVALGKGVERSISIVRLTVGGIWQLLSGRVGMENLTGPIGIGKFAGDYFQEKGWAPFLNLLAVISVNLGILNLLPITILDGGQVALTLAEVVRGAPFSMRVREISNTVGVVLIVMLMGVAFWNDITRHWSDFVDFFRGLL